MAKSSNGTIVGRDGRPVTVKAIEGRTVHDEMSHSGQRNYADAPKPLLTNGMATAGRSKTRGALVIHDGMGRGGYHRHETTDLGVLPDGVKLTGITSSMHAPDGSSANPLDPEPKSKSFPPVQSVWGCRGASTELGSAPSYSTGKRLDTSLADRVLSEMVESGSNALRPAKLPDMPKWPTQK